MSRFDRAVMLSPPVSTLKPIGEDMWTTVPSSTWRCSEPPSRFPGA